MPSLLQMPLETIFKPDEPTWIYAFAVKID
jgi:hypothetical protein